MCFLINFSQYLLVPLLIQWLYVEDYLEFDSSLCHHKSRKQFTRYIMYQGCFHDFIFPSILPLSSRLFDWASVRHFSINHLSRMNVTNKSLNILKIKPINAFQGLSIKLVNIRQLEINQCRNYNVNLLTKAVSRCNNLTVFILTSTEGADSVLLSLAQSCPGLRVCNIRGCKDVYDETLLNIAQNCINLTELNVCQCMKLSRRFIIGICRHGQKLQNLNIQDCTSITRHDMLILFYHFSGRLTSFTCNCLEWSDTALRCFLWWAGTKLTKLDVSRSATISDDSLCEVGLACPLLTDVNLSHCYNVSDYALIELAQALPNLTSLNLEYMVRITNKGVQALHKHVPHLKHLHFFGNSNILPTQLVALTTKYYSTLICLSLTNMFLLDDHVHSIVSVCIFIEELSVSHNVDLSDAVFDFITIKLKLLKKLYLSSCPLVTDKTLLCIGRRCKMLIELNHSKCSLLTDKGGHSIVQGCSRLQHYDMSRCSKITRATIDDVAYCCRYMVSIDYSYCSVKTDTPLMLTLATKLLKLRSIRNSNFSALELSTYRSVVEPINADLAINDSFGTDIREVLR